MFVTSGLTFKLHPLVLLNISHHNTRVKSQATGSDAGAGTSAGADSPPPPPRVFVCVIGVQRGRTVEIFNSVELLYDPSTHSLDCAFLEKKQELYKKVFPNFYILGWYSTGSDAQESDMNIHGALMDINESPLYVLLNPSINHAQKDLPITIYESVAAHLTGTHSAIKMLNSRIRVLHHYLLAMQKGEIPCENSFAQAGLQSFKKITNN
ncbi:hypothetical protein MTR67_042087 [Solanum verrucosum]|uniref:COP9 signalosome complex subunit 6 n=1 Tax=Solanum verrucosum TaxID=315347 RepID=A0AAF0UM59_SOLVR|nr:hypothetical protein MTR67_042087 [Solanum verrucosum]